MALKQISFREILEQTQVLEEFSYEEYKVLALKANVLENPVRYYLAFLAKEESQPAWLIQLERDVTIVAILPEDRIDFGTSKEELSFEAFKEKALARCPEIAELLKVPPQKPFWVSIFQFFLIPMGIVIISVLIYVFFGLATLSQKSTDQLASELLYKKGHARWQVAYELAKKMQTETVSEESTTHLLKQFESETNQKMRTYLAQLLGFTRNGRAFDALVSELDKDGEETIETRIHCIGALSSLAVPFKTKDAQGKETLLASVIAPEKVLEVLIKELQKPRQERDIKKICLNMLGNLQDIRAISIIQPFLKDDISDIRFNAALALAYLGDDSGQEILWQMLDRKSLSSIQGITPPQIVQIMKEALKALARLKKLSKEKLTTLGQTETNLEVKNLILKSLEEIRE